MLSNEFSRIRPVVLLALAGLAVGGCETSQRAADPNAGSEPRTPVVSVPDPVVTPVVTPVGAPVRPVSGGTGPVEARPLPAEAVLEPVPEAGPNRPVADVLETNSDGWRIVQAATVAERQKPADEALAYDASRVGPNLSQRLYGDLLETEIPASGEATGFHTVNIRQMSFIADGSVFDPAISPDGRHLVFAGTQHSPAADIYMQEVGSRVVTRLTQHPSQDVMPSLSPDGTRIAFASNREGNWDIWVMPLKGGRTIQVTSDGAHDLHPSWAPDGRHVVFCRLGQASGRWELWVADAYDSTSSRFIGYGLFPDWCPVEGTGVNGADRILFQRSRERGQRTFTVWTIDYDRGLAQAGNETQIASSPEAALINPAWSPDGSRITYAAVPNPEAWTDEQGDGTPPSASVWMIGIDGRGELPLTGGSAVDLMPTWSPSGQVFFISDRSGAENLWAVDVGPALVAASADPTLDQQEAVRAIAGQKSEQEPGGEQPPRDNMYVSVPTEFE